MTNAITFEQAPTNRSVRQTSVAIAVLFTLTSFTGAALLFVVQPLVAKLLLPSFGGSATVWSTSSMFFQGLLLLAYLYVHLASRHLGRLWQPRLHLVLLLIPLLALPLALPADAAPPSDVSPALWLLRSLLLMVGLPFAVLATSGPVLQTWYAQTHGIRASDPYFLFAASNLGSFGGLLAYPLLIEPNLTLAQQRLIWSVGFVLFTCLSAACGLAALGGARAKVTFTATASLSTRISRRRVLFWTVLGFLPASLSLAITAHLSTDVAAMPLLWVVPLAIYLATFVVAFARGTRELPRRATNVAAALALVSVVLTLMSGVPIWVALAADLALLAAVGLAAHTRLAADRPHHDHLTLYYVVISSGGALGAVFNGLVAPIIFDRVLEYPLTLALIPLLLLGLRADRSLRGLQALLLLLTTLGGTTAALEAFDALGSVAAVLALLVAVGAVGWSLTRAPALLAICLVAPSLWLWASGSDSDYHRSFFGAYRVETRDGLRQLVHGTTVHGAQFLDPDRRDIATTYYTGSGSIEDVMKSPGGRFQEVGVIGLGAGTVAAHGEPGQRITFFEIDRNIVRTARDPREFTYLADSRAKVRTVIGDGRLQVAALPPGSLDLLVLDAFSSDSIPVHLLTQEAMDMYANRLSEDGVLAVHISNRYFNLQPVLVGVADELGWAGRVGHSTGSNTGGTASTWVVLTPDGEFTRKLDALPNWAPLPSNSTSLDWTDDYSSVLSALKWFR